MQAAALAVLRATIDLCKEPAKQESVGALCYPVASVPYAHTDLRFRCQRFGFALGCVGYCTGGATA